MRDVIEFGCPHCGQEMTIRTRMAGQRVGCAECGRSVRVPGGAGGPGDWLIAVIRLPFGLLVMPICAVFWVLMWPLEVVWGIVSLPFQAIFLSRAQFKANYAEWPFTVFYNIGRNITNIWSWIIRR